MTLSNPGNDARQRTRSVLQKVKVNDVDIPEGVTKYELYKVGQTLG